MNPLDELLESASPALLVGMGLANQAVAAALVRRGHDVTVIDDHPDDRMRSAAVALDVRFVERPEQIEFHMADAAFVVPTPGLPEWHRAFQLADRFGVRIVSELDLAAAWDQRPVVAVTGTNGKTTVVELAVISLSDAGRLAVAAGNTNVAMVTAINDPAPELFVVEASSFRLAPAHRFEPIVGTWLNWAPDHLDVHINLQSYERAKARLFDLVAPEGAVVANAAAPVIMSHAARVRADRSVVTFGAGGHWFERDGVLWGPSGPFGQVGDLWRTLPHDVENTLAVAATLAAVGVEPEVVAAAASRFNGLAHRVTSVGSIGGVEFFDDSKATTPHATLAALRGFDEVVLIAGGRNKGIDLSPMRTAGDRIRGVVAIGEAAPEIREIFGTTHQVCSASDMTEAVQAALMMAADEIAVLLSPGCASFDWYRDYTQRGEDFAQIIQRVRAGNRP